MIEYEVLDEPRFVPHDDERVPSLAHDVSRVALSQGFDVRVALNRVTVGGKELNRVTSEGINRARGRSFYLELLAGEWHFAMWGQRLVGVGELTDNILGKTEAL